MGRNKRGDWRACGSASIPKGMSRMRRKRGGEVGGGEVSDFILFVCRRGGVLRQT